MTRAEIRVMQALLAEYPTVGFGTVANLARRAGVSDPTVVRLVGKLGFAGFPAFQRALLEEVEERLRSPLMMIEAQPAAPGDPAGAYLRSLEPVLAESRGRDLPLAYERATAMLLDRKARIWLIGGRFSRYLAGIFHTHLVQLRPGVRHLDGTKAETLDVLVDLGRQDVVVVFDYRRYQADVVGFARQAVERGARILLFTDLYRSPIAAAAQVLFTAPVAAGSAFDTMVPALAQIEALLVCLLQARDAATHRRLKAIETVRRSNRVTMDEPEDDAKG